MVTRDTPYPTTEKFLDVAVKQNVHYSLVWYKFNRVSGNRYLTRGSKRNILSITVTGNVSVSRWVLPLVNRPVLDFVMIH